MGRSTVHYADNKTNNALKRLHNKLRPAGTPVQRVEYIIELLLLRIFETKIKQDDEFKPLRKLFSADYKWVNPKNGQEESNENRLFSYLTTVTNEQILAELNTNFFPFYGTILQSARKVFEGNLPQKVQDQLVLIEEVFSNSNFTNNVNSGNLGEVIGIVADDIEESRLLQTDLLGDAIESALSETGGTKDIGLFRTPDHIRQFMTALVEPGIDDFAFDPACGTGGFLFDAFEFVMRRMAPDQNWPGEKAHSELRSWFDKYFEDNKLDFPSIEQTTQFYRSGIAGIEYLGMIRKMAAINFYIRGLNPANIEQGDSLAKFNPAMDAGSKTVVLANPPFGAERDQEAYPNVWGEHAKESETTILFVKLMLELLKKGGRCAVVVSEGFHTWDQFSAKALRKMLLDENQLRAVISLPQGLFVSKSGQGPKTSILLFEKGGSTDWVWFYKVTNDGYTMGTNRKEQPGSQLVECLTLYHQYVKYGKRPPETKHQFCIPAEWIKTLDPRIKEKIRIETRADLAAKGAIERAKKEADYDRKIKACKMSELEKELELKQFDHILENRIQNEIAKRIDKAHNYSFNLSNYRSGLTAGELPVYIKEVNSEVDVEAVWKKLQNEKTIGPAIFDALHSLNLVNALEADIVREFLSRQDDAVIQLYEELKRLKALLDTGHTYLTASIKELCSYEKGKLGTQATEEGHFPFVVTAAERKTAPDYQFDAKAVCIPLISSTGHGSATLKRIHYQEGKFALANLLFAAIANNPETELYPKYLYYILDARREELFCPLMKGTANVAMRMEDAVNVRFPLPPYEKQIEIVAQIDKQKALIEGAEKVLGNWEINESRFWESSKKDVLLGNIADIGTGSTPSREVEEYFDGPINWVLTSEVAMNEIDSTSGKLSEKAVADYGLRIYPEDTILIAMYGQGKTRGQSALLRISAAITQNCAGVVLDKGIATPKYVWYYLISIYEKIREQEYSGGGVPHLNLKIIKSLRIPLPNLETQRQIVAELDLQMQVLEGLRRMKEAAEAKINTILSEVWGVTSEPVPTPTEV